MFGLNYDKTMKCNNYKGEMDIPNGYVFKEIPKFTEAIFTY